MMMFHNRAESVDTYIKLHGVEEGINTALHGTALDCVVLHLTALN